MYSPSLKGFKTYLRFLVFGYKVLEKRLFMKLGGLGKVKRTLITDAAQIVLHPVYPLGDAYILKEP